MRSEWRDGVRRFGAMLAMVGALAAAPPPGAAAGERDLGLEGLRPEGLVSGLRANGAHVLSLGSRGGLDGYFVTPARGAGYSLYVTEDGHAVAGLLYDPGGTEITGAQLAATHAGEARPDARPTGAERTAVAHAASEGGGAPPSPESRSALFERTASAFGFTLGERGPVVAMLGDAACPWSRSAAAKLGREALAGRLQLRVVPVAILGADAARRAAAIAAHPDPARAWFEGPDGTADREGAERIARNNALLDAWGADAVPLIAWRAPGGEVRHRIGDIDDAGAWLRNTLRVGDTGAGEPRPRDPRPRDPQGGRRP